MSQEGNLEMIFTMHIYHIEYKDYWKKWKVIWGRLVNDMWGTSNSKNLWIQYLKRLMLDKPDSMQV